MVYRTEARRRRSSKGARAVIPTGHKVIHENIARRERWPAEAVERSLTTEERALSFKAGKLLGRVASYNGPAPRVSGQLRS